MERSVAKVERRSILELHFIFDLKIFSFDTSFKNFIFELVLDFFHKHFVQ